MNIRKAVSIVADIVQSVSCGGSGIRKVFTLGLLGTLGASPVGAQITYNFTGGSAGNWSSSSNWSPTGAPSSLDDIAQTTTGQGVRVDTNDQIDNITLNALAFNVYASSTVGAATTLTLGGAITVDAGDVLTFRDAAGAGTLFVSTTNIDVKSGATVTFGNANSQLTGISVGGTTTIEGAGIVSIYSGSGSAALGAISYGTSSTGDLILNDLGTASSDAVSVSSLSSSSSTSQVSAGNTASNVVITSTLTINGASGSNTYAGALVDNLKTGTGISLALIKSGSGTQILSGNGNTYSGGTTVNGGRLLVGNSSGSGIGVGSALVNSGGTLGGVGLIALGANAVTIASGGLLLAGDGSTASVLSINNDVNFNLGSILEFYLASPTSSSSLNRVGGTWSFASGQQVDLLDPMAGTFTLIRGLASSPSNVSDWQLYNDPGYSAVFSYSGGNVDVTVSAVPEPSTWVLFGGAALVLAGYRKIRELIS